MYDRNPMIEPKGAEWKRVEVRDAAQRSTHGSGDGNGRPLAESPMLTTATGAPAGTQQALTAGPRGPLLAQDAMLLEAMQHFNRERIAPRVVHAKGAGAYGVFTVTGDITRYTRAAFLGAVGRRTEVFVRFSVLAADQGARRPGPRQRRPSPTRRSRRRCRACGEGGRPCSSGRRG